MKTCFENKTGSYPIKLEQKSSGSFRVTYGMQVDDCLDYRAAALALGEALMHCAACDGLLDNGD